MKSKNQPVSQELQKPSGRSILIKNGRIVDGTGNPGYEGDILISDDTIERIGRQLEIKADQVIDAVGLVVCPGFIDCHHHTEGQAIYEPEMAGFAAQGVTTESLGHCGYSPFPDKKSFIGHTCSSPWGNLWWAHTLAANENIDWNSGTEYYDLLEKRGIALNLVPHIGCGTIAHAAGFHPLKASEIRDPTPEERERMLALISEGMEEGVAGLSSGISYPPDLHIPDDLRIEMLKIARDYGGNMQIHVKGLSIEGISQAIKWAEAANIPLHLSHINPCPGVTRGDHPTGEVMAEGLRLIEEARRDGMDITFDVMQYTGIPFMAEAFAQTGLQVILSLYSENPPDGSEAPETFINNLADQGFREKVKLEVSRVIGLSADYMDWFINEHLDLNEVINTGDPHLEGRTVGDIAGEFGMKPYDLFFDIGFGLAPMFPENARPHFIMTLQGTEENMMAATVHPLSGPATDVGTYETPDLITPWPQGYGSIAWFFRRCIKSGLRLEDTIRKMTSLPASVYQLSDRGVLKAGMKADIAIIDPHAYGPRSTYYDHKAKASGMYYTIVNGVPVVDNGKMTGERPGKVLRKQQ